MKAIFTFVSLLISTFLFSQALLFSDDFEGTDLWTTGTMTNQWERGVPAMININTAHSPVNVWGIDLDSTYANNTDSYLYSPPMVTTGIDSALLRFWHYYNTESNHDGALIQVRANSGAWVSLGFVGNDPLASNWYNFNIGGTHCWSGNSNGWIESTYKLKFASYPFNNSDTIQFRFKFFSDGSGNASDGWAIDDFSVEVPKIANDAGVIAINTPLDSTVIGAIVNVEISVKNFGTDTLTSIPVSYIVNTSVESAILTIASPGLLPDSTITYAFVNPYKAPNANYKIYAATSLAGDFYAHNDSINKTIVATTPAIDANVIDLSVNPSQHDTLIVFVGAFEFFVTIKVVNQGLDTLKAFSLQYKVGMAVQGPENWTGSLASLDTLTYTFTTYFGSSFLGWIPICANVLTVDDADSSNNEYCKSYFESAQGWDIINSSYMDKLTVNQSQPNPANGLVKISYTLPKAGKLYFQLRNTLGQIIINEEYERNVGNNVLEFDVSNMAAGVYFYTVEFEKQRITKKMIVEN